MDYEKIIKTVKSIGTHGMTAGIAIMTGMLIVLWIFSSRFAMSNKEIKLDDVKIAWDPAEEQVVFIDRKTNDTRFILTKELTTAVFALKASAVQIDFTNTTNGTVATLDASKKDKVKTPKETKQTPKKKQQKVMPADIESGLPYIDTRTKTGITQTTTDSLKKQ